MLNLTGPQAAGLLMIAAVVPAIVLLRYFWDVRRNISVMWFVLSVSSAGSWVFVLGLIPLVPDEGVSTFLLSLARTLGMASSVFVFLFILEYSVGRTLSWRAVLPFLIVPALTNGVLWTRPALFMDVQFMSGGFYDLELNRVGIVHVVYVVLLHIMSIALLIRESLVTSGMQRKQVVAVLVGYVGSMPTAFLPVVGLVPSYFNPGVMGLLAFLMVTAYALNEFGLFITSPMDKDAVFRAIDDAVVILNSADNVVDMNPLARELFGSEGSYAGLSADEVFSGYPQVRELVDTQGPVETISASVGGGERYFTPTISFIEYGRGLSGKILVLRDVTPVKNRERELDLLRQVFSRIFRHNVRNELSVARGYVELIRDRTDDEDVIHETETAIEAIDRLLNHTEKAREVEAVIKDTQEIRVQSLPPLVSASVPEYVRENPVTTVAENVDDVDVYAINGFEKAIENAIENAVRHNPPPVHVEITSEVEDDFATILIEDDGVGILESETSAIVNEEETATSHGSGVGLWLMKWYVERSNGDFAIENTGDGTRVAMRLPRDSHDPVFARSQVLGTATAHESGS